MSSFASIFSEAFGAITSTAGVSIKYARENNWIKLTGVPGLSDFEQVSDTGVISQSRSRDYLVVASELVLNGEVIEPQRGDVITEEIGNRVHTYHVAAPDKSRQPFRYSDTSRQTIRIHTAFKGSANR